jgi:poly(3-hydroxybutyrate) depolymerase
MIKIMLHGSKGAAKPTNKEKEMDEVAMQSNL